MTGWPAAADTRHPASITVKRLATAYAMTHAPDGLTSTVQLGRAPRFTEPNRADRPGSPPRRD